MISKSRYRAALFAAALAAAAGAGVGGARGATGERTEPLPGPARSEAARSNDPEADNKACEHCHADIAREWRGSLHAGAWTDSVFQQAYAIEPVAFCRGCHAPEADPSAEPPRGAQHVGIGCTTCHV